MRWNKASHCEFDGKSMETETTTWSEFPNGGKIFLELETREGWIVHLDTCAAAGHKLPAAFVNF